MLYIYFIEQKWRLMEIAELNSRFRQRKSRIFRTQRLPISVDRSTNSLKSNFLPARVYLENFRKLISSVSYHREKNKDA